VIVTEVASPNGLDNLVRWGFSNMSSVPSPGPKVVSFQIKSGTDAILHLDIPADAADTEYNVVIVAQRAAEGPMQASPLTFVLSADAEREEDGRWFAEIIEEPGAFSYGQTREQAIKLATALALRVLADRMEGAEESQTDSVNAEGPG
jgi:predicted RNase H-like HicB family nuclease